MSDPSLRNPVYDPQEPLLIARQHAGDVHGMTALFEPDGVIDCGGGWFPRGHEAIRSYYADVIASGRRFAGDGLPRSAAQATSRPQRARSTNSKGRGGYRRSACMLALLSLPIGRAVSSSRSRVIRAKPVNAFLASSADICPDKAAEQQFSAH